MDFKGLREKDLDMLNPYTWANHFFRFRLWIIKGYIKLDKAKNPSELLTIEFSERSKSAFRYLDDKGNNDDIPSFKEEMKVLGFNIVQMPPKEGPWNQIR